MPQQARRAAYLADVLAACALVIALASPFLTLLASQAQTRSLCTAINAQKSAIRESLRRSRDDIGQPGTAGYAYYSQHPSEVLAARARITDEIKTRWQNVPC